MAIINPGDFLIDPTIVDGTELADILNRMYDALRSGHLNATRPPYIGKGGIWTQDKGGGDVELYLYDGTTDKPIGSIENGSNANGFYTKFPDGTLIQHRSNYYVSHDDTVTLPIPFLDGNYALSLTSVAGASDTVAQTLERGFNYFKKLAATFNIKVGATSGGGLFDYVAIGRWK